MNQRNLKFWANVAEEICFGRTYKFGIGIWFSAVQWRRFSHWVSIVRGFMNIKFHYCKCIRIYEKSHLRKISEKKTFPWLGLESSKLWWRARTTDTQWRHKSKISEKMDRCGRQNMLPPYLKIWEWEWIFGRAVKAISSLGVRSPWWRVKIQNARLV